MANTVTTTFGGAIPNNMVKTAYDKVFEFGLRSQPMFRPLADKRPVNVTNPGESVVFQLYADMTPTITALTEGTDVTPAALTNTNTVTVTLNEYGNAAVLTRRLELDALSAIDVAAANMVAFNCVDSIDTLVLKTLTGGTNTIRRISAANSYNAGADTSITSTDLLTSSMIRQGVAQLRVNKVLPRRGSLFWCGIHPYISADLRAETGAGSWRQPHEYSAPGQIWTGEIGEYEGAFFVENPRMPHAQNSTDTQGTNGIAASNFSNLGGGSGSSTTQVREYHTYLAGQQALAEAVNEEPHLVIGTVADYLRRLSPMGWYGFLGWAVYRQEALLRLAHAGSLKNTV